MRVVEESYLVKCLDSGVYQSRLTVESNGMVFVYRHEMRLWGEDFLEDLRKREKSVARKHVMGSIRYALFGPEST